MHYINFYFKNLICTEKTISGKFESPDSDIYCDFICYINSKSVYIFNNNKPIEEITPIPIWWLFRQLDKNGFLNETEAKISY